MSDNKSKTKRKTSNERKSHKESPYKPSGIKAQKVKDMDDPK